MKYTRVSRVFAKNFYPILEVSSASFALATSIIVFELGGASLFGEWALFQLYLFAINELVTGNSHIYLNKQYGHGLTKQNHNKAITLKLIHLCACLPFLALSTIFVEPLTILLLVFRLYTEIYGTLLPIQCRLRSNKALYAATMITPKAAYTLALLLLFSFLDNVDLSLMILAQGASMLCINIVVCLLIKTPFIPQTKLLNKHDFLESIKFAPHKLSKYISANYDQYVLSFILDKELFGIVSFIRRLTTPLQVFVAGISKPIAMAQSKFIAGKGGEEIVQRELRSGLIILIGLSIFALPIICGYFHFTEKSSNGLYLLVTAYFLYFGLNLFFLYVNNKYLFSADNRKYIFTSAMLAVLLLSTPILAFIEYSYSTIAIYILIISILKASYLLASNHLWKVRNT